MGRIGDGEYWAGGRRGGGFCGGVVGGGDRGVSYLADGICRKNMT